MRKYQEIRARHPEVPLVERYDAFLSYARADAEAVRRLADNLHQLGVALFFDDDS